MLAALGLPVPSVPIECGSVIMLRQMLLAGDGLTLLSPAQVAVEVDAGVLQVLPPPVPVERRIGIISRVGWRPTATQAAFIDLLRKCGAQLAS